MSSYKFSFLLFICILCRDCQAESIKRVITSINSYVKYQMLHKNDITHETVIALRILQGSAEYIVRGSEQGDVQIDPYLSEDIQSLKVDLSVLLSLAVPKVESNEADIIHKFRNIIHEPWSVQKTYKVIDPQYRWSGKNQEPTDPSKHAMKLQTCAFSLLERKRELPSQQRQVEKDCINRNMILSQDTNMVGLEAQIMYVAFVNQFNFRAIIDGYMYKNGIRAGVVEMELRFCTNAFYKIQETVFRGQLQDPEAYLKMAFLCGSLGFMQFLHSEWLDLILKWQLPQGCFNVKYDGRGYADCQQYFSSAAIQALSQYLIFLAKPGNPRYQGVVRIEGRNHLIDPIHMDVQECLSINGHLPNLGGTKKGMLGNIESAEDSSKTFLGIGVTALTGIICVFVLVLGTMTVLLTRNNKDYESTWSLPMTARHSSKWD